MGLISKIKEAVSHDSASEHDVEVAASSHRSAAVVEETKVKATAETDIARDVTAAADRAAAADVRVVEEPAEVTVIDKGVEDVKIREKEAILQERENIHERVEVQPVIEKQVDETEIRQVVQPIVDKQSVQTEEATALPTESREHVEGISAEAKARYEAQSEQYKGFSETGKVSGETVVLAPKVEELHKKHIIQEVQPIIEREIEHTHVVKTTQPIKEHVVAGAKVQELQVNAPVSIEQYNAQIATKGASVSASSTTAVAAEASSTASLKSEIPAGANATTLREI